MFGKKHSTLFQMPLLVFLRRNNVLHVRNSMMVSKWWHDFPLHLSHSAAWPLPSVIVGLFSTLSLTHFTMKRQVGSANKQLSPVASILLHSIHDLWLSRGQGVSTRMSISKLLDLHGTHTKYESLSSVTFRPEKLQSVLKCRESPFEVSISPQSGPNNTLCFLSDFYKK